MGAARMGGEGTSTQMDGQEEGLVARLWGPSEALGFAPFITEGLDAAVTVELRRVHDQVLVWAASGTNGGLELMLD